MFTRRVVTIGLISMGLAVGTFAVASADGGVGFSSVLIGSGQATRSVGIGVQQGSDVVVTQNTITPGGSSGWHSHPGMTVVVVQSGELTLHFEGVHGGPCQTETYTAGQVFFELPQNEQNAVNPGSVNTVVAVTFFGVPHGGSARIDRPNPGNCL
jgi:quercetin dioxygenase-like cupin family protein